MEQKPAEIKEDVSGQSERLRSRVISAAPVTPTASDFEKSSYPGATEPAQAPPAATLQGTRTNLNPNPAPKPSPEPAPAIEASVDVDDDEEAAPAPKMISISSVVPKRLEAWVDYIEDSMPDITFPVLIRYISTKVAQQINQFTTGGRAGKKADPLKVREAYATFVFMDFKYLTDTGGQPLANTIQNRIKLLANTSLLAFVITIGNDTTVYIDTGSEEDQKK